MNQPIPNQPNQDSPYVWPALVPLDQRHNLFPFPVNVFAPWLAEFVSGVAVATQVPIDLPGTLVLGSLALAGSGRYVVLPADGWTEPLNLFLASVLDPANRKSATFSLVTKPIRAYERRLRDEAAPRVAKETALLNLKRKRFAAVEKQAVRGDDGAEELLLTLSEELAAQHDPSLPRLLAGDATPERLTGLLFENHGRIGLFSPEGGPFELMAGRYSGQPNLDVYLKGHAGDPITVDRQNRPSEHVERPALTIMVTVQNEVLQNLAKHPGFRGRGLLGRFLFSVPSSLLGRRHTAPPALDPSISLRYHGALTRLLQAGEPRPAEPLVSLVLGLDAQRERQQYSDYVEPQLADGADMSSIRDWAGKLVGAVCRIAGLLHLAQAAENPNLLQTPISGETFHSATTLGEYFLSHARVAFDSMGADDTLEGAKLIVAKLRAKRLSLFTRRDLHQLVRTGSRFRRAADLDPCLKILLDQGYLVQAGPVAPTGGRPGSPAYLVNPAVWNLQ